MLQIQVKVLWHILDCQSIGLQLIWVEQQVIDTLSEVQCFVDYDGCCFLCLWIVPGLDD
jgi:hypothetical protein